MQLVKLDDDIRIIRVQQDARFSEQGKSVPDIRVEFMVGDHGPFSERFEKAGYTADKRNERLNTFAEEIRP
jgi:hypothetical protein